MITSDRVFSRNIGVWDRVKQQTLADSSILVAGAGGLGCFVAQTLVRSGIGRLYLMDDGIVDVPDLNRQILYIKDDLGLPKVTIAAERLSAIHGLTEIIPLQQRLVENRLLEINCPLAEIKGFVDCLDNYPSRYLLERMLPEKAFLVHGGVQEHYGQVTTIRKDLTPSLKSLYANTEDSDSPMAVCSQAVSCVASIMSFEVLNNIWGKPQLLNSLLIIELSDFTFSKIKLGQANECI
ncbi:HesA/MoeB/ThiF family protein [bacterium]|nr:HesA/MoeB/ThiF family protein [bacterium]